MSKIRLRNVRLTCAIDRVRIQLHLVASAPFGVVLRETPLHGLILHSNGVAQGSELLQAHITNHQSGKARHRPKSLLQKLHTACAEAGGSMHLN